MYGGWEKENESMDEDNCKVFKLTQWKDTATICNTDVCKDESIDLKCKHNIKLSLKLILFEEDLSSYFKARF